MEKEKRLLFLASEVTIAEEEKLDPVFLKITMKLADSVGNKNHQGITASFISDLINRKDEFNCLPFYADTKNLLARNYDQLTHMYNRVTKTFSSTQIGSLIDFYSETDNDGVVSLYATARVPKREREICIRLAELYELGRLSVSFEVRYNPEHTIEKDGVVFIDAHEDNALTGMALVSTPACEDAVALDMVAEVADVPDIVAASEEQNSTRGEKDTMPKEMKMTAEVEESVETEEETMQAETEAVQEENPVAIADGEGASESAGEGASASGAGASESGGGAGASDGSGASDGGDDSGSGSDDEGGDALTVDHDEDDEKKATAESQETTAEVVEHSVDTHESVEVCPYSGEPVHVIEYHERIIETLEDAGALIAELDQQIAELTEIKGKYDAMVAEENAKILAEKQEKAKAFAEKQGLNVADTAVAEAIEKLDYEKIAVLSMAEEQEEEKTDPESQPVTLASFINLEVSDDNNYGGLLSRTKK